jgi:hypothetical protein
VLPVTVPRPSALQITPDLSRKYHGVPVNARFHALERHYGIGLC